MPARKRKGIYAGERKSKAVMRAGHHIRTTYGRRGTGSTSKAGIRAAAKYNHDSRFGCGSSDRATTRYTVSRRRRTPGHRSKRR